MDTWWLSVVKSINSFWDEHEYSDSRSSVTRERPAVLNTVGIWRLSVNSESTYCCSCSEHTQLELWKLCVKGQRTWITDTFFGCHEDHEAKKQHESKGTTRDRDVQQRDWAQTKTLPLFLGCWLHYPHIVALQLCFLHSSGKAWCSVVWRINVSIVIFLSRFHN